MTIYIGADHGGFILKQKLSDIFSAEGHTVIDRGNSRLDPDDDFPDFAFAVADSVAGDPGSRGILICRSAGGMTIAANKVAGIRAVSALSIAEVTHDRRDDDVNVLCLSADFIPENDLAEYVRTFLSVPFAGTPRYTRRLEKIALRECR